MKKKNRPLAPHLTIYTPQITSIVSIFHRISGSVLALSFISVVFFIYLDLSFSEFYVFYNVGFLSQIYLHLVLIIISNFIFMLICFHFFNGVRHLVWDLAIGLDNKNISITGLLVLGISTFCLLFVLIFKNL